MTLLDLFKKELWAGPSEEELRKDYRQAIRMVERAMLLHGVNSNETNYWSNKADELEEQLKKLNV